MSKKEKKFKTSHKVLIAVLSIVLFLLIIFAVLLVWQVSVTQESQNKEVDRIVSRRDGKSNYKTPYDFAGEEIGSTRLNSSHVF